MASRLWTSQQPPTARAATPPFGGRRGAPRRHREADRAPDTGRKASAAGATVGDGHIATVSENAPHRDRVAVRALASRPAQHECFAGEPRSEPDTGGVVTLAAAPISAARLPSPANWSSDRLRPDDASTVSGRRASGPSGTPVHTSPADPSTPPQRQRGHRQQDDQVDVAEMRLDEQAADPEDHGGHRPRRR